MNCPHCLQDLPGAVENARVTCKLCHAVLDIRTNHAGALRPITMGPPDPEKENLILARGQLEECARLVVPKPKEALTVLQDTWIGLWADIYGGRSMVEEVHYLQEKNAELATAIEGLTEVGSNSVKSSLYDEARLLYCKHCKAPRVHPEETTCSAVGHVLCETCMEIIV